MSQEEDKKLSRATAQAMAYLKSQCAVHGVAALNFSDGEMFMFSRKTVENLKKQLDESGVDEAIVYVQRGGPIQDA